jgi:hypothetical protein
MRQRFNEALNETSIKTEKPPLYVPTQRTMIRKDTLGYQPTIMQKTSQQPT